jgi:hypothetical protein
LTPELGRSPLHRKVDRKATGKRECKNSWREAGPPDHLDDKVDSDQQVVDKEISLSYIRFLHHLHHLGDEVDPNQLVVDTKLSFSNRTSIEREFFIDNLLVRIHLIIEIILVDGHFTMGV